MENQTQVSKKKSGLAIASLVLCLIPIPPIELIAITLGIIALVKISQNKVVLAGQGMAITGIIIGSIRIILWPFLVLALLMLPGVCASNQACLDVQTQSNLRRCSISLYAYAKDNNGTLPVVLDELMEEGYLEDADVIKNAHGDRFIYLRPGEDLYELEAKDQLAIDSAGPHASNMAVHADGSVE